MRKTSCVLFLLVSFFVVSSQFSSAAFFRDSQWSVFVYGGQWSSTRIAEIFTGQIDLESSAVAVVGVGRHLKDLAPGLSLEGESNLALHAGKQSHPELNAALGLRYSAFPWDRWLHTSILYGLGFSYAFSEPNIEIKSDQDPSQLLVFMPVELAFAPPSRFPFPWEGFLRIHHRSGAYGVISDARGSNFITVGIRHRF